jgi:hypothetical protein
MKHTMDDKTGFESEPLVFCSDCPAPHQCSEADECCAEGFLAAKASITELDQIIGCPNCKGGWRREAGRPDDWRECPVCETRAFLVIDAQKTMALERQPKPKKQAHTRG